MMEANTEETKLRGVSKTQCGGCLQYFTGMGAFEQHRIGAFDKGRRCMTTEEMRAAGMAQEHCQIKVYHDGSPVVEMHDVWFDVAGRESMRQRFAKMPSLEDGALDEEG